MNKNFINCSIMKQKFYVLTLAALICLIHQTGYAQKPRLVQITSGVSDTTRIMQKITISVKDLASSKLLDSVRVTLGKESKFTNNGVVVFEDNKDSIFYFLKPGYVRLVKKATSPTLTVSLLKSEGSEGFAINPGLSKKANALFTGSAV